MKPGGEQKTSSREAGFGIEICRDPGPHGVDRALGWPSATSRRRCSSEEPIGTRLAGTDALSRATMPPHILSTPACVVGTPCRQAAMFAASRRERFVREVMGDIRVRMGVTADQCRIRSVLAARGDSVGGRRACTEISARERHAAT
jgi:hypothetical protein